MSASDVGCDGPSLLRGFLYKSAAQAWLAPMDLLRSAKEGPVMEDWVVKNVAKTSMVSSIMQEVQLGLKSRHFSSVSEN